MLCGTQYWGVKIQQKKLGVLLMRMLQWTSGHLRHNMISNECIKEEVWVAPILEKMEKDCLRWFGHALRRPVG